MGKGVDLAAQIWMAQDVPEQGAQRGCGTGTMLVKWQNDSAGTKQPLPATQASAHRSNSNRRRWMPQQGKDKQLHV